LHLIRAYTVEEFMERQYMLRSALTALAFETVPWSMRHGPDIKTRRPRTSVETLSIRNAALAVAFYLAKSGKSRFDMI
jgi:hypothetical protein